MEPWFKWSWLHGIKPIHPNGRIVTRAYLMIAIPCMFASLGVFGIGPVLRAIAVAVFLASGVAYWVLVYWNLAERDR